MGFVQPEFKLFFCVVQLKPFGIPKGFFYVFINSNGIF